MTDDIPQQQPTVGRAKLLGIDTGLCPFSSNIPSTEPMKQVTFWSLKHLDVFLPSLLQSASHGRSLQIPTKKSKLFTGFEGQESFWIQVLEGELPVAKDNYVVGELRLDGLRPALGNRILVEVEFDIDANGILHVKASDLGSGSTCTDETEIADDYKAELQAVLNMGTADRPHIDEEQSPRSKAVQSTAEVLTLEDIVEEIIQEEIVDETDVYVRVFNPIWRSRGDKLSLEEVQNLSRSAPQGLDPSEVDWIYRRGLPSSRCTLILQGVALDALGLFDGMKDTHPVGEETWSGQKNR
eukprot:Skav234394  [mRNA]  locus=scaffold873:108640:116209:- [translate_table: standard]